MAAHLRSYYCVLTSLWPLFLNKLVTPTNKHVRKCDPLQSIRSRPWMLTNLSFFLSFVMVLQAPQTENLGHVVDPCMTSFPSAHLCLQITLKGPAFHSRCGPSSQDPLLKEESLQSLPYSLLFHSRH